MEAYKLAKKNMIKKLDDKNSLNSLTLKFYKNLFPGNNLGHIQEFKHILHILALALIENIKATWYSTSECPEKLWLVIEWNIIIIYKWKHNKHC